MRSHCRGKVFGHRRLGHGRRSVCLIEGTLAFSLRLGGIGLRAPELLGCSAPATSSGLRSNSENDGGDTGDAGFSDEIINPALLVEAVQLRSIQSSIEFDLGETVSNGDWGSQTTGKLLFAGKSCWVDVEAGEITSGTDNPAGVNCRRSFCRTWL